MIKPLLLACTALAITSCGYLPSSGPSRSEIYSSSTYSSGSAHIVNVTKALAQSLRVPTGYGFPSSFINSGRQNYETIQPGDMLTITVWENVDNGVFASLGQRVTQLQPMRVSANGNIFVPYVGSVKAVGRSPESLRQQITNSLSSQTPEPQVEVAREAGVSGGVRIFNSGGAGGLVPFNEGNLTLAAMIASSGGVSADPQSTRITLTRGNTSGTILAQDLFDNPRYDVALRNNDSITIEADRRYFRMLGAGGAQALVPFERAELSVLDAIAQSGGLNGAVADPSGIFVFRTVSAEEASALMRNYYTSPQSFVFTINLREPDGLFIAEAFQLRNKDTIYITEAPYVSWMKVISAISQTATSIDTIQSIPNALGN